MLINLKCPLHSVSGCETCGYFRAIATLPDLRCHEEVTNIPENVVNVHNLTTISINDTR